VVKVYWLGTIAYDDAFKIQEEFSHDVALGRHLPALLLLEHPHVYTLGRQACQDHILWSESDLKEKGISHHWVDRGGDVTYHGPGQLVGYPIIPLAGKGLAGERIPQINVIAYIRNLEKMLINTLAYFGVVSGQRTGFTGVWVASDDNNRYVGCDPAQNQMLGKIASIGIKVDVNGITRHGFALNVSCDPSYWKGIIPCGLENIEMVNLADLISPVPEIEHVRDAVVVSFSEVFSCQMEWAGL